MSDRPLPADQDRDWQAFCDTLKEAGKAVATASPGDTLDRAEGYRYLARLARHALTHMLEPQDPGNPVLHYDSPKIGGDNPDYLYASAALSPQYSYRLRGQLRDADQLGIGIYSGGLGTTGGLRCDGYVATGQLQTDAEGRFELLISRDAESGNGLALGQDSNSLLIRQTLLRRRQQQPAELLLERVDTTPTTTPPALDPRAFSDRLQRTAGFIGGVCRQFLQWTETFAAAPNELRPLPAHLLQAAQGDPATRYYNGYFELPEGSALSVELLVPACSYWNIQATNHWLESLDFQHHDTVVNCGNAVMDDDGRVRVVFADRDPGLPNWIDTAGHRRGCIAMRCVGATSDVEIRCELIRLDEACGQRAR